ncbi:MAG TPA: hypothetical protein VEY30_10545, partial [Myxococcaceae bacterium]|nr:hypothetical protein [Myxococcaceae bacterium]
AYSSRVVVMGFFHGEAKGLHLGEEYHHNRIDLVCSQISGVTPALRHRWDSTRLLQTFVSLTAAGRLNLKPLVTHVAPLNEAAALFEVLDKRPEEALQAVISFNGEGK